MTNSTKELKKMMAEDLCKLSTKTANLYIDKWLRITPETEAQKEYINRVITAALQLANA